MNMLLSGPGEDEDVIQVHKNIMVKHVSEHVID